VTELGRPLDEPPTRRSLRQADSTRSRRQRRQARARIGRTRAAGTLFAVTGELFLALGVVLLGFIFWQLGWQEVASARQQVKAVASLEEKFASPQTTESLILPERGKLFAVIRIPRLGADYARPVYEGTGLDILSEGVGHYQGTAMPGQVGNASFAGHRTTYGRPFHDLDQLRPGDIVSVQTAVATYEYAVTETQIVSPSAWETIAPVPGDLTATPSQAWLTLTSCHPRYSAKQRIVVHALLVESAQSTKTGAS